MPRPSDNPGPSAEIFPLVSKPGIKRDGTMFDGDNHVDGQWCRWQRGRPRKMGGYREMSAAFDGPIRKLMVNPDAGSNRIFCGSASNLQFTDVSPNGIGGGMVDITPTLAEGFLPNNYNTWQFGQLFDATSISSRLIAHAAPNLFSIDSTEDRKIFFGDINGSAPLTDTGGPEVSGGIFCNPPYVFAFGNAGQVLWCVPNLPDDWSGTGSGDARITEKKIVYGQKIRGGAGVSPASLLISLDSVIRVTFTGGTAVWDFDTISSQSSILSSSGVIEHNGIIYWAGIDGFKVYNGVVQDLPNTMNMNWFFNNLNWAQRQKVWATKVPYFGEIWWHYPRGNSEECNAAIIYNIHEQTWYDTYIDRSAGWYPQVFRWPVLADPRPVSHSLIRPSSGTPATSAMGTAANAFDGNPATDCTQTSTNGNISYDFGVGVTKPITRVGILPAANATYDLHFQVSDENGANWTTFLDVGSAAYTADTAVYFDLQSAVTGRAFRVLETGGGTLNLAEVYFLAQGYMILQHEFGLDSIVNGVALAIPSFFETGDLGYIETGPLGDRWMGVNINVQTGEIEPDMIQAGELTLTLVGRAYPRGEEGNDVTMTIPTTGLDYAKMDQSFQGRLVRVRVESNVQGGNYEMGNTLLHLKPGDAGPI